MAQTEAQLRASKKYRKKYVYLQARVTTEEKEILNICINKENIQVSSEVKSIYPSSSPIDPVPAFNCTIAIELGFPVIYETTLGVKCLNYFK